jgi:hypothetical protein
MAYLNAYSQTESPETSPSFYRGASNFSIGTQNVTVRNECPQIQNLVGVCAELSHFTILTLSILGRGR